MQVNLRVQPARPGSNGVLEVESGVDAGDFLV